METICGQALPLSFISGATWGHISDPLYYDGPLCSHYTRSDGTHWLYWWSDCNDTHNRWLLLRLPAAEIEAWEGGGMNNSRELWRKAERLIVADMNAEGTPEGLIEVTFATLPEDWLPTDFEPAPPARLLH